LLSFDLRHHGNKDAFRFLTQVVRKDQSDYNRAMINSMEPEICSKIFLSQVPARGLTFGEQFEECLIALEAKAQAAGSDLTNALMLTVFIKAEKNNDYTQKKTQGFSILSQFFGSDIPSTSFIAQNPEENMQVSLDAILLSNTDGGKIHHKDCNGIRYTRVKSPLFTEIYAAGLANHPDQTDTSVQCREAFDSLKRVLSNEGMDFSHIVRQWNYIANFLQVSSGPNGTRQNYQIFNDYRSAYYGEFEFDKGYPASTGIGMFTGGVVLECIAIKSLPSIYIAPLSNPLQKDAFAYSQDVLVGESGQGLEKKAPPLFERAKILVQGKSGIIYVSGTAAVRGQDTVPKEDIQSQTLATLENIDTLISAENLLSVGVDIGSNSPRLSQLRAYVKREEDLSQVKKICKDHYGNIPSQYVLSDVCREALLVEIEGTVCVPILGIENHRGG
jgi:enamine deaminase RidA (YjgF/YER057c/UK114 family)